MQHGEECCEEMGMSRISKCLESGHPDLVRLGNPQELLGVAENGYFLCRPDALLPVAQPPM